MKRIVPIIIFITFISDFVFSQNQNSFDGKVLDEKTKTAIPFATVCYPKTFQGVISNSDGSFRIVVPSNYEGEFVEISCIGYKTKKLPLSNFDLKQSHNIYLEEKSYSLDEAKIVERHKVRPSALRLVNLGIINIKKNYPDTSFLLDTYYRDYLKIDSSYVNMFEAIVKIEDQGFLTNDYKATKYKIMEVSR